jgi:maleylacetoacetate isomerase/maleylpyruvate isomerase
MLKLFNYYRSSASFRARIALHYKGLAFEYIPVHLLKGEHQTEEYLKLNPMKHVPALVHDGFLIAETVAICDYLDAMFPEKPLFPSNPRDKALVMQLVEIVNSGIQPLQNLKVTTHLEKQYGLSKAQSEEWIRYWIGEGFGSLEKVLERTAGTHAFGGTFTAADAFIVPQDFAANRFNLNMDAFPNLARVNANAMKLDCVQKAHPTKQPDFQA